MRKKPSWNISRRSRFCGPALPAALTLSAPPVRYFDGLDMLILRGKTTISRGRAEFVRTQIR